MVRKTYLYTKHEWEEALAVHRPAAWKAQGLEGGSTYQLTRLGRQWRRTGESGVRERRLSMVPMLACQEAIHNGFVPKILRPDRRRQSVTRRTSGYDQSSPSVGCRQRLWAIEEESSHKQTRAKAVQVFFSFGKEFLGSQAVVDRVAEMILLLIFVR